MGKPTGRPQVWKDSTCILVKQLAPIAGRWHPRGSVTDLVLLAPDLQLMLQRYCTHLLLTMFDKLSPWYYGSLRAYRQVFYRTHRKY